MTSKPGVRILVSVAVALAATSAAAWADEPVAWRETWGVAAAGGGLTKTGPAGWNAGAISSRSLVQGDGYLEFSPAETGAAKVCGLGRHSRSVGFEEIDFAFSMDPSGGLAVVERGLIRQQAGSYAAGDRLRVAIEAGAIVYRQNGTLVYASAVVPAYPLLADGALHGAGAGIADAVLSGSLAESVSWANTVNARATGYDLQKTAGGFGWNAGAASTRAIAAGDGYVEVLAETVAGDLAFGLSNGDGGVQYEDIDFAFRLSGTTLYVSEGGTQRGGNLGSVVAGDRLRVAVEGGLVRYSRNGQTLYTSAVAPTYPLLVDASLSALQSELGSAVLVGALETVGVEAPAFSLVTGTYESAQTVVVSLDLPGATIRYTTNGAEPTPSDPVVAAGDEILVDHTLTLKARAWSGGLLPSATTAASYAIGAAEAQSVVWTDLVGVTADGNSLTKHGVAGWNAGAVSTKAIASGDGYMEVTVTEVATRRMLGLGRGNSGQGYADIDFALYLAGWTLEVYEGGTRKAAVGTCLPGDRLRVSVESGVVKYSRNGSLLYASALAPAYPLLLDTSLDTANATVSNASISGVLVDVALDPPGVPVEWTDLVGVTADGNSLTKPGAGGWDAGAVSTKAIASGDGYMEVTVTEVATRRMLGLSHGNSGQGYADIDFAFYLAGWALEVYEGGTRKEAVGTCLPGDRLRVSVESGVVKYSRNGSLLYASALAPTYPLLLDTSLDTANATVANALIFGGLVSSFTPAPEITPPAGLYPAPFTAKITAASPNDVVHYTLNGSDPGPSDPVVVSGGIVAITDSLTLKARAWRDGHLASDVASTTYTAQVATPAASPVPGTYVGPRTVTLSCATPGAEIRCTTDGSEPAPSSPPCAGITLGGSTTVKAKAFKGGWQDSDTMVAEYAIASPAAEEVVWSGATGVMVSGNDLTKTAASGWGNAGAVSAVRMDWGPASVEFVAGETNTSRACGLSQGNTDDNLTDIDFAIGLAEDATVRVYESGTQRGTFGSYAAGDRFRVEAEPGVVRYLRNGSVFYTSAVVPRFPLLVDTALDAAGATIQDVVTGTAVFSRARNVTVAGATLTKMDRLEAEDFGPGGEGAGYHDGDAGNNGGYYRYEGVDIALSADVGGGFQVGWIGAGEWLSYPVTVTASGTYTMGVRVASNGSGGTFHVEQDGVNISSPLIVPNTGGWQTFQTLTKAVNLTAGARTLRVVMDTNGATGAIGNIDYLSFGPAIAAWNAGAVSSARIETGDGYVEAVALETNTERAFGLSRGDDSTDVADIDFAVQLQADGTFAVREGGVLRGSFGAYAANDLFRIEILEGVVRYQRNGSTFYTSAGVPTYPLQVDTALYTVGATLADIKLVAVQWANAVNVSASGGTLTKTGSAGWNGGASSTASFSGDGWMEFSAAEMNTSRVAGLGASDSSPAETDVDFGVLLKADGTVGVLESGVSRGSFGTYAAGDRFRVEVADQVVRYRKNGVVFYTSTTSPTFPLRIDTALDDVGATLRNVVMGRLTWTSETGAAVKGASLLKTGGSGWNASARSSTALLSGDGALEVVASERTSSRVVGFANVDNGTGNADVRFGLYQASSGGIEVLESGTSRGSFGQYVPGDRLRVALTGGTVRYSRNGAVFYTSTQAVSYPLFVDTSLDTTGAILADVSFAGTLEAAVQPLVVSPAGGTYSAAQTARISCGTPGAVIRYTTDGTEPTPDSEPYPGPIAVSRSLTLRARAWREGFVPSPPVSATYVLVIPTPGLSPDSGTYTTTRTVTVTEADSLAAVHYTTTGLDPTEADPVITSGASLTLVANTTVKVRAFRAGWQPSPVSARTYQIKVATPGLSPASAWFTGPGSVQSSSTTPGARLYYTETGADPTEASAPAGADGRVPVNRSATIKVRAFKAGCIPSDVASGSYFVDLGSAGSVTITPAGGTFDSAQVVSLLSTMPGDLIRYTLDGSEPGASSPRYAGPVLVARSLTLRARAFRADHGFGAEASSDFMINAADEAPGLSPAGGRYATRQDVTLGSSLPGAVIRFTTSGADPTEASESGSQVAVDRALIVKARAYAGGQGSRVAREDYLVTGSVAAGLYHFLALRADGRVLAWGQGDSGQIGDGSKQTRTAPVPVPGLADVVQVAGGEGFSLAVTRAGRLYAWGSNSNGQFGTGATPAESVSPYDTGITDVAEVAAGQGFTLVLKRDGRVYAMGDNTYGKLGCGSGTGSKVPCAVSFPPGASRAVAVKTGVYHSVALLADGTVYAWGRNANGELGDGTTADRNQPKKVDGLAGVSALAAGRFHSVALRSYGMPAGEVLAWGSNGSGQLCDGTTISRLRPVLAFREAAAVHVGGSVSFAVLPSGVLRGCGRNDYGQLGDGSVASWTKTSWIQAPAGAVRIAATAVTTLFLRADGSLWTWGSDYYGMRGNGGGDDGSAPLPAPVPDPQNPSTGLQLVSNTWLIEDGDNDGLPSWLEYQLGSDPLSADTNGDGVPDAVAIDLGLDPADRDLDKDGLAYADELRRGTDPNKADTDGDGVLDGADCYPLDPGESACPADPTDTTPPAVTLTEPATAVPVP